MTESALAAFAPAPGDLRGAAVLSAVFLVLLAVAELWRRLGGARPEWSRKLVHLAGGVTCLAFPFLVRSPVVVLGMAVALTAVFALGGRWGVLQSLHGIDRPSRGAEYYPLAVFLVFLVAQDRPWLYVSAVLVLAVADAFAALVGSRYGAVRYEVEDEQKSLEGSLVFLVIAFLAIHLPVLLMTDLPRGLTVLAALLVAVLVTGFEAISLRGADNLFVPVAVVVILAKITSKPLSEVVFQCLSLAVICLVLGLAVRRFRSFNAGGAITFILFAYGAWSLGSWHWALPVFVGFVVFALSWMREGPERRLAGVRTRTVARALVVPFAVLALANGLGRGAALFGPYLAACGAVLAQAAPAPARVQGLRGPLRSAARGLGAGILAWAVTALPAWAVQPGVRWLAPAAAGAVVVAVAVAGALLDRRDPAGARDRGWTARRFLLAVAAVAVLWAVQAAGLAPAWDPSWMPRLGWR